MNRRYREQSEDQIHRRVQESLLRQEPIGLTGDELGLRQVPVTRPQKVVPVFAWVRYPSQAVRVQAFATAWTARAVQIEFLDALMESRTQLWVWSGAVERAVLPGQPSARGGEGR